MALAWSCWREFCPCLSWCPGRSQQPVNQVFQWVVGPFLRCLPPDRSSQQTAGCTDSGRPSLHCNGIGVWISFASSTASSVKQSVSYGCWGVNILNSTEDNGYRCHTPTVVRKKPPTLPYSNTALFASSYNKQPYDINHPAVDVVFV